MKVERSILGSFLAFARGGTTIDAVVVSELAYPDVTPTTNWSSLGCVIENTAEYQEEDYTIKCPSPSGGYSEKTSKSVTRDSQLFTTEGTNPLWWELAYGFAGPVVDGVPQTPFSSVDRYIYGWLKAQIRGEDGLDRIVMNVWGKLRLAEQFKASEAPTRPSWRFDIEYSSIATAEPDTIIA